jgi:hypothetical protein
VFPGKIRETADPSAFAPNEQKINPTESISISSVHFTLKVPQACRLLPMTKERAMLP